MISEGSCASEDWSNDAGNTDLITGINYVLKYIQISAVKRFLACNNVCNLYIYYVYINTPMYIFKKKVVYILNLFIYDIIYIKTYTVCVSLYIINIHITYIM